MFIYVRLDSIIEKKLTWEQIEEQYDQEWVELIDYDWPEGMPYPQAGTVRVHASDCKTFYYYSVNFLNLLQFQILWHPPEHQMLVIAAMESQANSGKQGLF
jgi:hypothetical protein